MTDLDINAIYQVERDRLADELTGISDQQWGSASLCSGWTARDVAAHLLMPFELGVLNLLGRMVVTRFNFDRMADRWARGDRRSGPELVETFRTTTPGAFRVPGAGPVAPLSHLVIHAEDMRKPLGLRGRAGPEATQLVLDDLARGAHSVGPALLDGLRLVATDSSWSHGEGPEVSGTGSTLASALNRRAVAAVDLVGPGAGEFRSRVA